MPWGAFLRLAGVRFSPVLVLVALVYTFQLAALPESLDYGLALWAAGMASLGFVGPLAGSLAAWEVDRLRRGEVWSATSVRRRSSIVINAVWPSAAGALLGLWLCGVFATKSMIPPMSVAVDGISVVTANVAIGAALGSRLRAVIAIPLLLVGGYCWMYLPWGMEPMWLRHLSGTMVGCCVNDSVFHPDALYAVILTNGGLLIAAVILLLWPFYAKAAPVLAVLPIVLGVLAAAPLLDQFKEYPTAPRQGPMSCRVGAAAKYCVWPEHGQKLPRVADVGTRSVARWKAAGLDVPPVFTERTTSGRRGKISVQLGLSDRDLVAKFLEATIPLPSCEKNEELEGIDWQSRDALMYWLTLKAGIDPNVGSFFGKGGMPARVQQKLQLPANEQAEWFIALSDRAQGHCVPSVRR